MLLGLFSPSITEGVFLPRPLILLISDQKSLVRLAYSLLSKTFTAKVHFETSDPFPGPDQPCQSNERYHISKI